MARAASKAFLMALNEGPHRDVVSVTQSPMNVQRWLITLKCKHEVWVTSKRKPQKKKMRCLACRF